MTPVTPHDQERSGGRTEFRITFTNADGLLADGQMQFRDGIKETELE